jgi:hypothetical protein
VADSNGDKNKDISFDTFTVMVHLVNRHCGLTLTFLRAAPGGT